MISAIHTPLRGRLLVSYLANNQAFKGVGLARASALWRELGEDLYRVLEEGDVNRLSPIIGETVASELVTAWAEKQEESKVIDWLDRHGFNIKLAYKVIKIWGAASVTKLAENPYRMLAFAPWTSVDQAAHSLGIAFDDDRRLIAAVESACYVRLDAKHTLTAPGALAGDVRKILKCGVELASRALSLAAAEHAIVEAEGGWQPLGPAIMERYIAKRLQALMTGAARGQGSLFRHQIPSVELDSIIRDFEVNQRLNLTDEQRRAVVTSVSHPLFVLTGGAGVGKTTTLRAIHDVSERVGRRVIQMALSGRASRQLREATGRTAMTIAAFLNSVRNGKLSDIDDSTLIIVDEASMLDLPSMYRILRAVSPRCNLVLVGDPYQLPPIGFGLVFHVLASLSSVPHIRLTHTHRQSAATGIPDVANAVRVGIPPELKAFVGKRPGVSFISTNLKNVPNTIIEVVNELGGIGDVQILAPTKRGPCGVNNINSTFHDILSIGKRRVSHNGLAEGEPVIYLVNNYEKDLSNGSLGRVIFVDDSNSPAVDFGHTQELLDQYLAKDLALAYSITVHKSQGSQFPCVIVPVTPSRLLDRTLIYTAITRATHQVVLIGDYSTFRRVVFSPPFAHLRQTGFASSLVMAGQ